MCFNVGEADAKNVELQGKIGPLAVLPFNAQQPLVKTYDVIESGKKFVLDIKSEWQVRELDMRPPGVEAIVYFDGNGAGSETTFCRELRTSATGKQRVQVGGPLMNMIVCIAETEKALIRPFRGPSNVYGLAHREDLWRDIDLGHDFV